MSNPFPQFKPGVRVQYFVENTEDGTKNMVHAHVELEPYKFKPDDDHYLLQTSEHIVILREGNIPLVVNENFDARLASPVNRAVFILNQLHQRYPQEIQEMYDRTIVFTEDLLKDFPDFPITCQRLENGNYESTFIGIINGILNLDIEGEQLAAVVDYEMGLNKALEHKEKTGVWPPKSIERFTKVRS